MAYVGPKDPPDGVASDCPWWVLTWTGRGAGLAGLAMHIPIHAQRLWCRLQVVVPAQPWAWLHVFKCISAQKTA